MRWEDRIQCQSVPLLGKILHRKCPIELIDQVPDFVRCSRYRFYRDLFHIVHVSNRTNFGGREIHRARGEIPRVSEAARPPAPFWDSRGSREGRRKLGRAAFSARFEVAEPMLARSSCKADAWLRPKGFIGEPQS